MTPIKLLMCIYSLLIKHETIYDKVILDIISKLRKGLYKMTIRNFQLEDKQAFISMCNDFYNCGATLEPIKSEQMEQTFQYIIEDNSYVKGFIFEQNGEVAGYGLVFLYYSNEVGGLCGFLDEIYISPTFRGEGLGGNYLKDISSVLGEDIKGLRLEVCHTNKRAIKLYEEMGFTSLDYKQMVKIF